MQAVFEVAGQEDQVAGGLVGGPPVRAVAVGPVGGGDQPVEQVFLDGGAGGQRDGVTQLARVGQAKGGFAGPGVVDGAGEAGHQRGGQRPGDRRGRCGGQRGADRRPPGRATDTSGIGQVGSDIGEVQGVQADARGTPAGAAGRAGSRGGTP